MNILNQGPSQPVNLVVAQPIDGAKMLALQGAIISAGNPEMDPGEVMERAIQLSVLALVASQTHEVDRRYKSCMEQLNRDTRDDER